MARFPRFGRKTEKNKAGWEHLKARLLRGDDSALEDLPAFLRGVIEKVDTRQYSEDELLLAFDEVMVTLMRTRMEGRLEAIRNLRAYCLKIALRGTRRASAQNRRRRHPGVDPADLAQPETPDTDPVQALMEAELRGEIRRIMDLLAPKEREALELAVIQGLTRDEILEHFREKGLHMSRSGLDSLMKRARQKFRKHARRLLGPSSGP